MSARAARRVAVALGVAFAVVSVLAVTGAAPRGPLGQWTTPFWADVLLAPFSGEASLLLIAAAALAVRSGRLPAAAAPLAIRLIAAVVALTVVELVLKAAFPSTSGQLGPVAIGPLEIGFYPSGHSGRAALYCIAACLWLLLAPRWSSPPARAGGSRRRPAVALLAAGLLAVPALVGVALVAAGGHFPIDVAGGILLGAALAPLVAEAGTGDAGGRARKAMGRSYSPDPEGTGGS